MDNGLFTAQLFLGTMYAGFVSVPLNVRAGVLQLSYMLDHCDADVVFAEAQYEPLIQEAMRSVSPARSRSSMREADGAVQASEGNSTALIPPLPDPDDVAMADGTAQEALDTKGGDPHPCLDPRRRAEFSLLASAFPGGSLPFGAASVPHQRRVRNPGSDSVEWRFRRRSPPVQRQPFLGLD